jgi:hypothetical protein
MPASLRQSAFVTNFSMPNGLDEQCTWMSVGTLIVFVLIARELMLAPDRVQVPVPRRRFFFFGRELDARPGEAANAESAAAPRAPAPVQSPGRQQADSSGKSRKRKRR